MRTRLTTTIISVACVVFAAKSMSAPTSQPTSMPTVVIDTSTPKSALKSLTLALYHGDSAAVRGLLLASTPTEDRMSHVMADLAEAVAKLNRAAIEQFGEKAAVENQFGSTPAQVNDELAMLASAKEIVDGDNATVSTSVETATVHLKRIDGRWKVAMTDLTGTAPPAEVDTQLAALAGQARVLQDATTDISAGKYKSAADAALALRGRVDTSASSHTHVGPRRDKN